MLASVLGTPALCAPMDCSPHVSEYSSCQAQETQVIRRKDESLGVTRMPSAKRDREKASPPSKHAGWRWGAAHVGSHVGDGLRSHAPTHP